MFSFHVPACCVEFEWDDSKHAHNLRVRGFGFDVAAQVFAGGVIEWLDDRHAYGEVRIRALGMARDALLHVVYTDRGSVRRIISARRANRKERLIWQSRG